MKRTYKKKSNLINNTGYTPGYATEKNPVNYIPSENITMANTPYPLKATPLDEYGNPIGQSIIMSPGGEYRFNGASYVEERPVFQRGGRSKAAPSLERQLLNKYVDPAKNRAMERAKSQGIRTGTHNGGLDAIRHSSSAAATSSILPSWANAIPGVLPANIAMTNLAGIAHEVNSPNSFKEHASDLYNNFVGSVVGVLPVAEETKHNLLISAQKNGILSDIGNKKPLNKKVTPSKKNSMNNTTSPTFNRNVSSKKPFTRTLPGNLPGFGKGGEKNDWISAKISKLVREEGYPQKQAVAMAYEMYDNMHKNGGYQLPIYQIAGTYNFGSALPKPKFGADPNIQSPEAFSESLNKITEVNPGDYGLGKDPNYVNALSTESLTAGEDFKKRTDEMNKAAGLPQTFSPNVFGAEVEDTKEKSAQTGLEKPDIKGQEPFQFFNPYGGVDIPTANVMFGQSLENKDTLGAVASGAKIALGTARNILGGMGQARRENYVKNQYYEKQREGMTGAGREEMKKFGGYYQEGGMQSGMEEGQGMEQQGAGQEQQMMQEVAQMLQQGADPQQVIQQLVQMGVPQDQAVQMVQAIMQQMQGSTPQLKRGGMMYYQDGGEDEEDEEEGYGYEDEEEPNYMINKPSLMGKQQNFSEPTLATSPAIESAVEATSLTKEEEETPSYDKNSARDTWVAKTGMPWSEAKRLGYTDGSAKDNMKLLSELNDPRFKKEYLRNKPLSPAKKKKQEETVNITKKSKEEEFKKFFPNSGKKYINPSEIRQKEEDSYFDRTIEILGNPLQSLGHYSKYGELPASGFSRYKQNNLDQVIDIINPAGWASHIMNASKDADQGQWKEAGEEALGAAAALRMLKPIKYIPLPKGLPSGKAKAIGEGAKRLGMEQGGYYQYGGDYDTYNEKDFKDNDIVRHSGGNTGLTKSELNSLAKQYKMSPQEFLNIISYGEPGEGMSSKYELSVKGSDKYLPKNWRETYKQNKTSTTGFRGALNKGLDYIGVDPIFNMGGYYQDGGEQQIAQQVAQAMQQGMQPQEAMSMLMESGMTEDQAVQMVQAIMQQLEQQPETPQLRRGGEMIKRADGSYSRRGLWDNIRDNAGSGNKPTKEMLEQEAKIKREYQEGGMEPGADPAEAMMQQISQMLQQGAEPEQIMQMLIEAGVPEDQAMQMVQAVMEQIQEPQGTPQMRDGGIPERYRKMGFTKVGAKKQSTSEGKKWMVLAKKGDQYKVVHGGDDSMKDFSQHGSEDRKDNFWNRMGGRDSAKANDPFSPLYWHKKFGTWQEGGEMMDEQMEGEDEGMENESAMLEQIESQVEEALKQGADPQQVLQQLVEMGIPEEQAIQMIQEILQEIQGGETGMEAPEESTPQMSKGGKYMRALVGKTIKNYTYNPKTDSYTVSYE